MRALFGCGPGAVQFGFDFSSLEARTQAHYVFPYKGGPELAVSLVAEKPDDVHCFQEDTEILTQKGWKTFDKVSYDDNVAQVTTDGKIEFVNPSDIIWKPYSGDMYSDSDAMFSVTGNHRIYYESSTAKRREKESSRICLAQNFEGSTDKRFLLGGASSQPEFSDLCDDEIRLIVAIQADACLSKDCSAIVFSFVKERKVHRIESILNALGVKYTYRTHNRKGRDEHVFRLNSGPFCQKMRSFLEVDKTPKNILLSMSARQLAVLVDEVVFWDGTLKANNDVVIDTTSKETVDFIQTACSLTNRKCIVNSYNKNTSYGKCFVHRAYISKESTSNWITADRNLVVEKYSGYVGCVTVPSGLILTRRKGVTVVSGNSVNSRKLGIERGTVKSVTYAILYGCSPKKLEKMLQYNPEQAKQFYNDFWDAVPALRDFKNDLEQIWEKNDKTFLPGIDGRLLRARSKHSIINLMFQSCGVIVAKYVTIFVIEEMERRGYNTNPFKGELDFCSMIEAHDELQCYSKPDFYKFKVFKTEEEAESFVDSWDNSLGQLSSIGHSDKGYYVCLPNEVSQVVNEAISKTEALLKLNVKIGMEWIVGRNWENCH